MRFAAQYLPGFGSMAAKTITIDTQGDIPHREEYLGHVNAVIHRLSSRERGHLKAHGVSVLLIAEPLQGKMGSYHAPSRTVVLSTATPDDFQVPPYLQPVFSHFGFCAAHELTHPLLERARLPSGTRLHLMGMAEEVHERACAAEPELTAAVHEAYHNFLLRRDAGAVMALDLPVYDMSAHQLAALYVATFTDPDFYGAYGYVPEHYLAEMTCNLRGLVALFGEEPVRALAGEFLDVLPAWLKERPVDEPSVRRKESHSLHYRLVLAPHEAERNLSP